MRVKGLMVGLLGGLALAGLLYYPLYLYLPGRFIADWPHARADIAWICAMLSPVLLIFIGLAGGHWSGLEESKTFVGGSAAGAIAAVISYGLIIAPASGVFGSQNMLLYGFDTVPDEISLTWIVLRSVTETLWWGAAGFWLSVLLGAGLGALGGWFAEPELAGQLQWSKLFPVIDPLMIFVALLNHILSYSAYYALMNSIAGAVIKTRYVPIHSFITSVLLLNITSYAWILFWQLKLWMDLRNAQKQQGVQLISWALASFTALIPAALFLILFVPPTGTDPFSGSIALISITVGVLTFRDTFWKKRHLPMPPAQNPLNDFGSILRGGVVLTGFMTMTLMTGNMIIPFNLVLITIPLIAPISGNTASLHVDLNELINAVYSVPRGIFASVFVATSSYVLLLIWNLQNVVAFLREYGTSLIGSLSSRKQKSEEKT